MSFRLTYTSFLPPSATLAGNLQNVNHSATLVRKDPLGRRGEPDRVLEVRRGLRRELRELLLVAQDVRARGLALAHEVVVAAQALPLHACADKGEGSPRALDPVLPEEVKQSHPRGHNYVLNGIQEHFW